MTQVILLIVTSSDNHDLKENDSLEVLYDLYDPRERTSSKSQIYYAQ